MTKKAKHTLQGIFLIFLIVTTAWILMRNKAPEPYRSCEGRIFGTTFHITYQNRSDLETLIIKAMNEVDASLSMFNKQSTLSLINSRKSMETDEIFREVFTLAHKVSEETDGDFDITIAPLVNVWGFGFKNKENVNKEKIDSILNYVGYTKIKLQDNKVETSDSLLMLDFSAIAKGYGCDRVVKALKQNGTKNFMVEIGGEICTEGHNQEGKDWTVGIITPTEENKDVNSHLQSILQMPKTCLATSGNYRNFYYENGKKYAHTINPHTGYPIQHSLLSATVIAPTCAEADAYATSFMVGGLNKAKTILEKHPELQALLIYADRDGEYQTWTSENLKPFLK